MFPELEIKEGWVTVVCLLLIFLCVAWAIQASEWAEDLAVIQGTALVGGLAGIVLAKSRFPSRMGHVFSLLAGWTWSAYLTATALADRAGYPIQIGLIELEARVRQLFYIPFNEGTSADNYVFVLLLAFLLWVMAYFGAWAVFRWQRTWWALIVCGAALLININYSLADLTIYLILFLLFGLLLVVRANVAFHEQEWRQAQVGYSSELVSSFLQAGLVVSILVILLAWAAPEALASRPLQPIVDKIGEPWRRLQDRSARVFQNLNYQNQPPMISLGDRRTWFGGAVHLADTPVADIEADSGRFWRVRVYHDYLGNGWLSNDTDMILIEENEQALAFPEFQLRQEISQTVTPLSDWAPEHELIAAGQPLRAGVPLRASVSMVSHEDDLVRFPDGSAFPPAPGDPSALYSRQSLASGQLYQVLSSITKSDEESLRQAGTAYPNWVVPRYLQVPDSLPERVRTLAQEVTAGQENAYDKAKAIETYLRQIPYNEGIDGPGPTQDGVDYFLFDAQEGYCDYFASAMVMMLRSVDVPARYVRGYSNLQREEGVYHLLESDGHAWPEVFFPNYGWVEFEPTSGRPALSRPRSQDPQESASNADAMRPPRREIDEMMDMEMDPNLGRGPWTSGSLPWYQQVGSGVGLFLLAVALGLGLYLFVRVRRLREIEGLSAAERVYADLVSWVRRLLRIEPLAHQTPLEYAGVVAQNVPPGRQAVERIASLYVEERFGGKVVSPAYSDVAWHQAWQALRGHWLMKRFDVIRRAWWWFVPPKGSAEE